MACRVAREEISRVFQEKIIIELTMIPEDASKGRYQSYSEETKQFFFFVKDERYIHLPIAYASVLFQMPGNDKQNYPEIPFEFTGRLREKQVSVCEEAEEILGRYGGVVLNLYPGFGKTITAAYLSAKRKLLTVILVDQETLARQWLKTFTDNTNASCWVVGEKFPDSFPSVIICMCGRWEQIPIEVRDSVGFLVIDEAHKFCTPGRVAALLTFHPKYVVAETASLERDDELHKMIIAITGNQVISRELFTQATVYKTLTGFTPKRVQNRQGVTSWSDLVAATLADEKRNLLILQIVQAYAQHKILILTLRTDHVLLLHRAITSSLGLSCDYLCDSKSDYQDGTVLVGTMAKIGTGFDPANCCPTYDGRPFNLLIIASSIKKYSMLVQNVGRVFRCDAPLIFHLVDNDPIYARHWSKCQQWYRSRQARIEEYNPHG